MNSNERAAKARKARRKQVLVQLPQDRLSFVLLEASRRAVHTVGPSSNMVEYASSASSDCDEEVERVEAQAARTRHREDAVRSTQSQPARGEPLTPSVLFLEVDPNWDPSMGDATLSFVKRPKYW